MTEETAVEVTEAIIVEPEAPDLNEAINELESVVDTKEESTAAPDGPTQAPTVSLW